MHCPFCGNDDTQVKDSRPAEDNSAIRRRRSCNGCGARFTTFERVQLRELTVVKKNAKKAPFERGKLEQSVNLALRKRPIEDNRINQLINGIVRQLESLGDAEVQTEQIGKLVMEGLKHMDPVAYVRYASVYKDFREARDFEEFVGNIAGPVE